MSSRTRRRQQTEAEILAAAEALVLSGDPEALTAHGVARAIGVTPGALYRYFEGIDAIVARVQARVLTDLFAALEAAPDPDPLGGVVALTEAFLAFTAAEPARYALLARLLASPRAIVGDAAADRVLAVALRGLGAARSRLTRAREAGALAPGDDTERLLAMYAALHGAVQVGKLARFAPEAAALPVGRAAVDGLLRGWGAAPGALARAREGTCR